MYYVDSEYEHQIERMRKLGINVDAQMFEQSVTTVILLLEQAIEEGKISSLK